MQQKPLECRTCEAHCLARSCALARCFLGRFLPQLRRRANAAVFCPCFPRGQVKPTVAHGRVFWGLPHGIGASATLVRLGSHQTASSPQPELSFSRRRLMSDLLKGIVRHIVRSVEHHFNRTQIVRVSDDGQLSAQGMPSPDTPYRHATRQRRSIFRACHCRSVVGAACC
jgi:hypothetical protein